MAPGTRNNGDGLLGGILSIDDKIARLHKTVKKGVQAQKEQVQLLRNLEVPGASGVGNSTLGAKSDPRGLLIWPDAQQPTQSLRSVDPTTYTGTLLKGINSFDFETGEIELGGGERTQEMSQSLQDIGADFVRSIELHADNHIAWYIPSEKGSSYQNQMRTDELRDIEARELVIQAFEPTNATLFCSTSPEIGIDRTGPDRSMERVSYSMSNGNGLVTVDDSFADNVVNFTTEADAMREEPALVGQIHTMNVNSGGVNITNRGNEPVEVNIQVRQTLFHGLGVWRTEDWADMSGYTTSNPVSIPAGSSKSLDLSPIPHHILRFRLRCGTAGATTDASVTFTGITE